MPEEQLRQWAASRGYDVAWGRLDLLDEVQEEIERRLSDGEIDRRLADQEFPFDFAHARSISGCDRLVVVVMPRPAHVVHFTVGSAIVDAVMPPTYVKYRPTFAAVRDDLAANGLPGARVDQVQVPLKAAASRLGLVQYGRNNVTYGRSAGSYHQLLGYVTDAPLPLDPAWRPEEPRALDECEVCGACEAACPTGAIAADRFLLHAERCLTFVNESPGPWPDWVPASSHTCLVGCLACQRCCPANATLPTVDSGVTFDAAETAALMAGARDRRTAARIQSKLQRLGQPYREQAALGRNLRSLLDARQLAEKGR